MGILHFQVTPTTGRKEKRPRVPLLGVHLNTLGSGPDLGPLGPLGRGQDLASWDLESRPIQTLRPGGWDRCKGLQSMRPT